MFAFFARVPKDVRVKLTELPRTESGRFIIPIPGHDEDACCPLSAYMRLVDPEGYGVHEAGRVCSGVSAAACAIGVPHTECYRYGVPDNKQIEFNQVWDEAWDVIGSYDTKREQFDIQEAVGLVKE